MLKCGARFCMFCAQTVRAVHISRRLRRVLRSSGFTVFGGARRRGWEEACARNRVVAAGTAHIDTASFDSDSR